MAISKPRNRVVLFRLTQDEYQQVQQACTEGGARSVSDYARARILGLAAGEASALSHIEAQLAGLARAVEHLTRVTEEAKAARSEYPAAAFLAKSGD